METCVLTNMVHVEQK